MLLTLPQLARVVDVEYRTLHSWVNRGLLAPSLQVSAGTGVPNLFGLEDAVVAKILADMREFGASLEQMQAAGEQMAEQQDELMEGAFVFVNGKVEVTRDAGFAQKALDSDGWTLVYRSEHAVTAVRERLGLTE
jgi:DNA-binding transcriptional MerR regulator